MAQTGALSVITSYSIHYTKLYDGTLSLTSDAGHGAIFLHDGKVINAQVGRVEGEKAFSYNFV